VSFSKCYALGRWWLNQNCYVEISPPMALHRERWSAARRSAGERKLLFNSPCLRQDATSRFHLAVVIYDPDSFDWLWPEQNPIVDVVRRFVPFGETTNAPRFDWKIAVLLHLPRPTLTLDLQLLARSSSDILRLLRATLGFLRVITILQCRFLLFKKIGDYLGLSLWKRWRMLEWYNKTVRAISIYIYIFSGMFYLRETCR